MAGVLRLLFVAVGLSAMDLNVHVKPVPMLRDRRLTLAVIGALLVATLSACASSRPEGLPSDMGASVIASREVEPGLDASGTTGPDDDDSTSVLVTEGSHATSPPQPDEVEVFAMEGQLAEDFQSLSEITSASPLIIVGTVLEAQPTPYQDIPFTVSTVQVDQVIKGDPKAGATVTIVETGGLIAGRSKDEPGQYGKPAEAAFEWVRVMAVGEQWLLFLGPYDPGPLATNAFSVKGVFQGKVRVEGDGKLHSTGPTDSVDSPIFRVPTSLDGRNAGDVVEEVRALVR